MGRKKKMYTEKVEKIEPNELAVESLQMELPKNQVPKTSSVSLKRESYRSAESFLISAGTSPTKIAYMSKWAEGKGYTVATNDQWKEIFAEF